jgi:hypothetical protein
LEDSEILNARNITEVLNKFSHIPEEDVCYNSICMNGRCVNTGGRAFDARTAQQQQQIECRRWCSQQCADRERGVTERQCLNECFQYMQGCLWSEGVWSTDQRSIDRKVTERGKNNFDQILFVLKTMKCNLCAFSFVLFICLRIGEEN